jgi:phosphoserine phosphatase
MSFMQNDYTKVVFTDIDGTLLEGFVTIDLVEYLHSKQLFNDIAYLRQRQLMSDFKKGGVSFSDWLQKWAELWGEGIKGQSEKEILSAAEDFFPSFTNKLFSNSKKLVQLFHSQGYFVVGISVGVIEAANLVGQELGLDFIIASKTEVKNGVYTGRILTQLHSETGKSNAVKKFAKQHGSNLAKCIGVGDTPIDEQIFLLTGKKLALNPNKDLLEVARKKEYLIATNEDVLHKVSILF